jgi:hypothetical protein
MFVLEEIEGDGRRKLCSGTVAILGSSSRFDRPSPRLPLDVYSVSFEVVARDWEKAKTFALERMVEHVAGLNPVVLREASDFLLNVGGAPVGKPALERLVADEREDSC